MISLELKKNIVKTQGNEDKNSPSEFISLWSANLLVHCWQPEYVVLWCICFLLCSYYSTMGWNRFLFFHKAVFSQDFFEEKYENWRKKSREIADQWILIRMLFDKSIYPIVYSPTCPWAHVKENEKMLVQTVQISKRIARKFQYDK